MTPNRSPQVYELEREIASLPVEDKLQLRDGIDRQIRAAALGKSASEIESELEEMANDPDIQRELAAIELEFSTTAMETVFLCFQVRSIDPSRFPETPVGMLSPNKMREVEASVRYVLGL
jgi:hypothetical protein